MPTDVPAVVLAGSANTQTRFSGIDAQKTSDSSVVPAPFIAAEKATIHLSSVDLVAGPARVSERTAAAFDTITRPAQREWVRDGTGRSNPPERRARRGK